MDLSLGLRLGLRDKRLFDAFLAGKASIADDLVFPCSVWDENEKVWLHGRGSKPVKPDDIAVRYMQPPLEKAGRRGLRFHDLRHTFLAVVDNSDGTFD